MKITFPPIVTLFMIILTTPFMIILTFIGIPMKWLYRYNLYLFKMFGNLAMWSVGSEDRITLNFVKPLQWIKKEQE